MAGPALVLLPMLWPAIAASLMVAFAISIDDFVISAFLSADQSSITIPVRLYSAARVRTEPSLERAGEHPAICIAPGDRDRRLRSRPREEEAGRRRFERGRFRSPRDPLTGLGLNRRTCWRGSLAGAPQHAQRL